MFFVNPWIMAFGVAAAFVPVLVHWLTRPRPVLRPLSTVRFVLEAVKQRRARHRLRDFVILAARSLAVLLLAAAIARPLLGRRPPVQSGAPGLRARVVVFDVSQSMAARTKGIQAIERARPVAAAHLAFQPGLAANLLLAGATTHAVFDRPSTNFGALRDELGKAVPRPERLNVRAALDAAARMLAQAAGPGGKGGAQQTEVVILSDFQRTQWATADFSVFPRDTQIQLESAAAAETPANLAVLRVAGAGRAEVGRPLSLDVDVGNFSTAARPVELELSLKTASYRASAVCAAGAKTTVSLEIVPRAAGWLTGRARLIGISDALVQDDALVFVVNVREPPVFALITREPAASRPSSSYYLERALIPAADQRVLDRPSPRVVRFDPERDDPDSLATAEVFALDHPGRLSDERITSLAGWLRRGRSVFYVACEPADALNLKRLADLAGTDLRLPVEFAPPLEGGNRTPRFIADLRSDLPPFAVFGDAVTATLAPLRFSGALVSHPLEGALADDVRASFGDKSACLVVSTCGAGTLAILNADLGASNLPTSSAFVPLIGELMSLLLGRRGNPASVACGEPFALPLPADAGALAGLTVRSEHDPQGGDHDDKKTDQEGDAIELIEEPAGLVCRSLAAGPPGVIRIERGQQTVFALALATPEQESDLAPLPASVFQDRLAGGRTLAFRDSSQADEAEETVWAWLALACAVMVAGELILLRVLRT